MKLMDALTTNDARTYNGALTNSTTSNHLLDLFFIAGASRNMPEQDIINLFVKALHENETLSLQLLLWARDCRGGAGERRFFRIVYNYLKANHSDLTKRILHKVPELGRWDDLWSSALTTEEKDLIAAELNNGNALLAKWVPRRSPVFAELANWMGLSLTAFRKLIVGLSKTVEQYMSRKDYSFEYSHVPSVAMSRYGKAFARNDQARFSAYLKSVEKGESKINASTLFPYDCLKTLMRDGEKVANLQWNALPNYYTDENVLVVCDVSGSMGQLYNRVGQVQPIEVSISLALYASERNRGIFRDSFITFSERPEIQKLSGRLSERVSQLSRAAWGMNTDLAKVFQTILDKADQHAVPASEMPSKVLIISDMEFDSCVNTSNFDFIKNKYESSGYSLPQVVFWNVNGRAGNCPIKHNEHGVALVSGASPSILKSVLGDLDPISTMLQTIDVDRYRV